MNSFMNQKFVSCAIICNPLAKTVLLQHCTADATVNFNKIKISLQNLNFDFLCSSTLVLSVSVKSMLPKK